MFYFLSPYLRYRQWRLGLSFRTVFCGNDKKTKITYLERESSCDQPAILFVHGFSGSCGQWLDILQVISFVRYDMIWIFLKRSFFSHQFVSPADGRILAIDLPGHGQSPGSLETANINSMIEVLKEVSRMLFVLRVNYEICRCYFSS